MEPNSKTKANVRVKTRKKITNTNAKKSISSQPKFFTKEPKYGLIDFYSQPEFLQILSKQLADQPKVNIKRVNQIKEEIDNNNYDINSNEIAEKIINLEKEIFKD